MNFTVSEVCSQVSDAEKGKVKIWPAIPFVPDLQYNQRAGKNKDEFISDTCSHRPSAGSSKKSNYVI